jgi:hypothetical protein
VNAGQPHVLTTDECQQGLAWIAMHLLGSAAAAAELIALNHLIPPYVSVYPGDAFGPALDTAPLTAPAAVGTAALTLTPHFPGVWIAGNLAWIAAAGSGGLVADTVTLTGYTNGQARVTPGLAHTYPPGTPVTVYAPLVQGGQQVLLPGQILYLPVSTSSAVASQGALTDAFGTDLASPVAFANGDLAVVSGVQTLVQRLATVLATPQQSWSRYPTWGSLLSNLPGSPAPSDAKAEALLRVALLQLPEVTDVTDVQVQVTQTPQGATVATVSCRVWVATSPDPLLLSDTAFTLAPTAS